MDLNMPKIEEAAKELSRAVSPYFLKTGDEQLAKRRRLASSLPPAMGRTPAVITFSFLDGVETEPGKMKPDREGITTWIRYLLTADTETAQQHGHNYIPTLLSYPLKRRSSSYESTYSVHTNFMTDDSKEVFLREVASTSIPKAVEMRDIYLQMGNLIDAEISNTVVQLPFTYLGESAQSPYGRAMNSVLLDLKLTAIGSQYPLEAGYPDYSVRLSPEAAPKYLNGRADLMLATNSEGHYVIADIKNKMTASSSGKTQLAHVLQLFLYAYCLALRTKRPIAHLLLITSDLLLGKLSVTSFSFQPVLLTKPIFTWQRVPLLTEGYDDSVLKRLRKEITIMAVPTIEASLERLHIAGG